MLTTYFPIFILRLNMIKGPLAFLELLLRTNVFKVLLTLERRVVYVSHEHIQANTCNK